MAKSADPAERAAFRLAARRSRRDLVMAGYVIGIITPLFVLDAHASLAGQRALGAFIWLSLLGLLWREPARVRAQVVIVVVFATCIEYTFSPLLGVYTYRLQNVPSFVPPGHGVVYLAALALGRSALFAHLRRLLVPATLLVAAGWAAYGAVLAPRRDILGLLFFLVLARFLLVGRAPLVYAAAFLVCSYLELVGTSVGTWAWARHDPFTGACGIGNPPSGIPGAYCIFDATALAAHPALLTGWARLRRLVPAAAAAVSPARAGPS